MSKKPEAKARSWFEAKATSNGDKTIAEIMIYDEIGLWGITAKDFADALKGLGKVDEIVLSINSPGGSVFDGVSIYNMLKRGRASVTARIDGVAASIASVIAMAADRIIMPSNAFMMVHDPSGVVMGNSKDMRALADALDKVRDSMAGFYSKHG